MKKFFYLPLLCLFGCKTSEKLGEYKYKTKIQKVNTGDYKGMVNYIKTYSFNNKFQAGCNIKSQKYNFQKKSDSVFSTGEILFNPNTKVLKCKEIYFNGYNTFLKYDTLIRTFKQNDNGELILLNRKVY